MYLYVQYQQLGHMIDFLQNKVGYKDFRTCYKWVRRAKTAYKYNLTMEEAMKRIKS